MLNNTVERSKNLFQRFELFQFDQSRQSPEINYLLVKEIEFFY